MNRNDEYKEYYLTLEDLWNELNDICDELNAKLKQELLLKNNQLLSKEEEIEEHKQQLLSKEEEIERQNKQLLAAELKFEFLSDLSPIKTTGSFIYIWSTKSYAIKNIFKIGLTNTSVQQRLEHSGTSLIEDIVLLKSFECGDADYLEKQIHSLLNGFRFKQNREFFKLEYNTLLQIVTLIASNNSETVQKVNEIINQYVQTINSGILPEMHEDVKRILDSTDYVRCFFEYVKSKGLMSVELKDIDQKIEDWKRDFLPQIPIGFKSILQKKFKDANNLIEYQNPQDEEPTIQKTLKIEKKLKPRVMFIMRED